MHRSELSTNPFVMSHNSLVLGYGRGHIQRQLHKVRLLARGDPELSNEFITNSHFFLLLQDRFEAMDLR